MQRIRAALERLESRVARLEGRRSGPLEHEESAPPGTGPARPEPAYSLVFTRLAVICFALVIALVLRELTRRGWLDALPGALLGLGYCAALLAAPFLAGRIRAAIPALGVLQICGVILAPLVVVETVRESAALTMTTGALIACAFGLAGGILGAWQDRRHLVAVSLLAATAAMPAVGLEPQAVSWRGGSLVLFAGLALWLAHRKPWPGLRLAILVPAGLLLGFGIAVSASRPDVPPTTAPVLLGCALGLWALVALNHGLRARRMRGTEASWLPVVTLWTQGLAGMVAGATATWIAIGLACLALGIAAWQTRSRPVAVPCLMGLIATGVVGALASLPFVDPSGLGLAALALAVFGLGRRAKNAFAYVLSHVLALAAFVSALVSGWFGRSPCPSLAIVLLPGAGLAMLLFLHAWALGGAGLRGRGATLMSVFATASLGLGLATLFGTLRLALQPLMPDVGEQLLVSTVLLAGLSVLGLVLGRLAAIRPLTGLSLLGVGLLVVKVLLVDLFTLQGGLFLGSVVSLGVAFAAAALALGRSSPATPGRGNGH